MVKSQRQQSWSEYLDSEKRNKLFVRYVFAPDYKSIAEFAVSYLIIENDDTYSEILRYDCSEAESVHVHKFFCHPPLKKYLDKEKSFETLMEFADEIRKNWRIFLVQFSENKQ